MSDPILLVLSRLKHYKKVGSGWSAPCSAHDDKDPSLTVSEGRDGRALLHCHAGCSPQHVVAELGLEMKDLFPHGISGSFIDRPHPFLGRPEEVYPYTDEDGNLLFQVLRYPGKQFRQRSRDALGRWTYTTAGVRKPLYNLPAVRHAITERQPIFIVEGEKDAESLIRRGLVATTIPNGAAGHWLPDHTTSLRGADVVIIPDNDETGRRHALKVTDALLGVADRVRVVRLDGMVPEKEDVTFFLEAGGTLDQLRALVEDAPAFVPTEPMIDSPTDCHAGPVNRTGFVRASELEQLPPVEWIVQDFIPAGETVGLIGAPGAGKSFVMIDLALSIAAGMPWHGREVQPGTVAIIAAEGASGLPQRIRAWKQSKEMPDADVHLLRHAVPLLDAGERAELLLQLGILPQPIRLVVVDTLAQCMAPDGDENSAKDMGAAMQLARDIAEATCAAVIFIHHPGKGGTSERGSSSFRGAAAVMIHVERDGQDVVLETTKVRDGVAGSHLRLTITPFGDSAVLTESPRSATRRSPSMRPSERQILTALSDGEPRAYGELERASGVQRTSFQKALRSLVDRGAVVKDSTTYPATYLAVLEEEVASATEAVTAANSYPAPTPAAPPVTTPYRGGGGEAPSGVSLEGQPFSPRAYEEDVEEEDAVLEVVDR